MTAPIDEPRDKRITPAHSMQATHGDRPNIGTGRSRFLLAYALFSIALLQGCNGTSATGKTDEQAPEPTVNSNPKATEHLKISVEDGSGVNHVEVRSIWTVGNIGCAPIQPVSGAAIVKQVEVQEKIEKVGSDYLATVIHDRFLPGKCRWEGGAYEIHFMHDTTLMAVTGAGPVNFGASSKLELTCIPPPHMPVCDLRNKESFDRAHFPGVFNATLEKLP